MLISIFDKLPAEQANSEHLGGKGFGLWWMQQQGVNVPPALIIPTTLCVDYMTAPKTVMASLKKTLVKNVRDFFITQFGYMPLLSIRSGARVSMPGMMDTILNVGLDSKSEAEWVSRLGADCTLDSYRRLITMYGNVVKGVDRHKLEFEQFDKTASAYKRAVGTDFPDSDEQILGSVEAVFQSWNNERAKVYRKMHNIPETWGTAVVIQAMVFGNFNDNSGTGVLFTRNPDSGDNVITGEFLTNAQGEDVVAGTRTPMPLSKMAAWNQVVADELLETVSKLEKAKRDVQDVEFTIMDGKLYILQTRNAKRSARAALRIALDMRQEGMITEAELFKRVGARELDLAAQPVIDPKFKIAPAWTGIPACSGMATGEVVLSSAEAVKQAALGKSVILVTKETTPDDIQGMVAAKGVVTMTGGSTSHAAVVARSMNKACVVGVGAEYDQFKAGQIISIDGATGRIWMEAVPVIKGENIDLVTFRNLLVGDRTLLVDQPPPFPAKNVMLDLSNSVVCSIPEIKKIVDATIKLTTGKLTVMLPDTLAPEFQEFIGVYLTAKDLNDKIVEIQDYLTLTYSQDAFNIAGWEAAGWTAIDCKSVTSLVEMVLLKNGGLVTTMPQGSTTAEKKAFARVAQWLSAEGVSLKVLNSAESGVASWTKYVHG